MAKAILGVDISSEMIHLAETKERENPMGCRYMVHNVATLPELEPFDLVVAMYLLNYAKSKDELLAFCKAAYRQLKPGGLFIGVNDNPGNDLIWYESYRKYGFIKQSLPDRKEGDPIRYTFYNADDSQFQFNNYYLHPETYEAAFAEAGFIDFQWRHVSLDPAEQEKDFWNHFLAYPPIIGFSARKKS
jgi:SAM-dependent methyltransferase